MWKQVFYASVALVAAWSDNCCIATHVEDTAGIWASNRVDHDIPSSRWIVLPRGQHQLVVSSKPSLAIIAVFATTLATLFLIASCFRWVRGRPVAVNGAGVRYLALAEEEACWEEELRNYAPVDHPQLKLLSLTDAEIDCLSPSEVENVNDARSRLTEALWRLHDAEEKMRALEKAFFSQKAEELEGNVRSAAHLLKLEPRLQQQAKELAAIRTEVSCMEVSTSQVLDELKVRALALMNGRRLTMRAASALAAASRILYPGLSAQGIPTSDDLKLVKGLVRSLFQEAATKTKAVLARTSPHAKADAKSLLRDCQMTRKQLLLLHIEEEAEVLGKVSKGIESVLAHSSGMVQSGSSRSTTPGPYPPDGVPSREHGGRRRASSRMDVLPEDGTRLSTLYYSLPRGRSKTPSIGGSSSTFGINDMSVAISSHQSEQSHRPSSRLDVPYQVAAASRPHSGMNARTWSISQGTRPIQGVVPTKKRSESLTIRPHSANIFRQQDSGAAYAAGSAWGESPALVPRTQYYTPQLQRKSTLSVSGGMGELLSIGEEVRLGTSGQTSGLQQTPLNRLTLNAPIPEVENNDLRHRESRPRSAAGSRISLVPQTTPDAESLHPSPSAYGTLPRKTRSAKLKSQLGSQGSVSR